ncbi:glycosyltransferase family 2 protein [Pontibacter silvestris]|uniref:Glycosyltransferase family 2 protein n=1 Tax=Pontibacter silvestris TaxID=2305183 RepID=A0ABW4WXW1_9BACT|nr:glycosyltransferase [Pontibacter silvestris]MCC9137341.1 glycosyltransferase [Pontibacter silvestris]
MMLNGIAELPLVSVIMPAYNAGKYIAESIKSVVLQTYVNWELIVIDDGSTDNTASLVKGFVRSDCRIKYLYQENGKQGKARNTGISAAKGKYIAFIDSDDLWLSEKLEIQIKCFSKSEADLIFSDTYIFRNEFLIENTKVLQTKNGVYYGEEGAIAFIKRNRIPTLTAICKKKVIDKVGGFTEKKNIQNAEDYHLWLKILLHGYKIEGIDYVLAAYRDRSDSVSDENKLNLKQVIEAQIDVLHEFSYKHKYIYPYIIKKIKDSLYVLKDQNDNEFYESIIRYLKVCNKNKFILLFKVCKMFRIRRLAFRSVYFVFNYF